MTTKVKGIEGIELKDFPGYFITEDGKVFSSKKIKGELKQSLLNGRYYKIGLCRDGKMYYRLVHRLVAQTYLTPVEGRPHVNHIDGNKLNNTVDNLEWSNYSHNIKHAWKTGLRTKPTPEQCRARMPNHVRALFHMEAV